MLKVIKLYRIAFVACLFMSDLAGASGEVLGTWVTYKSGDDTVKAFLTIPEGKGPFPGLIVIHEWWGLNEWIQKTAKELSGRGYVALAVDLYRGEAATSPEVAHAFMNPNNRKGYSELIAKEAWGRIFGFLDVNLKASR